MTLPPNIAEGITLITDNHARRKRKGKYAKSAVLYMKCHENHVCHRPIIPKYRFGDVFQVNVALLQHINHTLVILLEQRRDSTGAVTLSRANDPYDEVTQSAGVGSPVMDTPSNTTCKIPPAGENEMQPNDNQTRKIKTHPPADSNIWGLVYNQAPRYGCDRPGT